MRGFDWDEQTMSAAERVAELLLRCGQVNAILPPTELFNEGWMLRLVLDWASSHPTSINALRFAEGSTWYSEALMSSRFKPRKRGDQSGEGFTHADAVIGHFRLRPGGRGDIELLPGARQLTVVEAKMASGLSPGTKYAPDFNQAARDVACIAHLLSRDRSTAGPITHYGFVVIAPNEKIAQGAFHAVDRDSIAHAVERRARSFDTEAVKWCESAFRQILDRSELTVISWETVLDEISRVDADAGAGLSDFYKKCLRYNPLVPRAV